MKNTNYTPGPWNIIKRINTDGTVWIQGPNHDENGWREVCSLPSWPSRNEEIIEANARLIAAAPELLSALEDAEFLLRKAAQLSGPMQDSFKRSAEDARAAIAKAKGGAA